MNKSPEAPYLDPQLPPQADLSALKVPMPWPTKPNPELPTIKVPFPDPESEKQYTDGTAEFRGRQELGRRRVDAAFASFTDPSPLVEGTQSEGGGYPNLDHLVLGTSMLRGSISTQPTAEHAQQETPHVHAAEATSPRRFTAVQTAFSGLRRVAGLRQSGVTPREASAYPKPKGDTPRKIYGNWLRKQGRG